MYSFFAAHRARKRGLQGQRRLHGTKHLKYKKIASHSWEEQLLSCLDKAQAYPAIERLP